MEAASVPARTFDHLREHSIGLPQVLFARFSIPKIEATPRPFR